jgi:hypothetical protein
MQHAVTRATLQWCRLLIRIGEGHVFRSPFVLIWASLGLELRVCSKSSLHSIQDSPECQQSQFFTPTTVSAYWCLMLEDEFTQHDEYSERVPKLAHWGTCGRKFSSSHRPLAALFFLFRLFRYLPNLPSVCLSWVQKGSSAHRSIYSTSHIIPNCAETYTPVIVMHSTNFGLLHNFSLSWNLHPYYCGAVNEIRLLMNCAHRNTWRVLFVLCLGGLDG